MRVVRIHVWFDGVAGVGGSIGSGGGHGGSGTELFSFGMVVRQWFVQYQRTKAHDRPFLLVGGACPNGEQLTDGKTCRRTTNGHVET